MKIGLANGGIANIFGMAVVLIVAMSYANNLAFLIAFLLVGFYLVSFVLGRAEIRSLEVLRVEVDSGHAGEKRTAHVWIRNLRKNYPLVAFAEWDDPRLKISAEIEVVEGGAQQGLPLAFQSRRRGRYPVPSLFVSTTFPAGIFRFSQRVESSAYYFVYPRLRGNLPLPGAASGMQGEGEVGAGRGEDFTGHRTHQPGESERHVDWKLFARNNKKQVKEFRGGSQLHYFFSEGDLGAQDFEAKVEQLGKWVSEAHRKNIAWGFDFAGVRLEAASGQQHYRRCMEILSTIQEAG